MSKRLLLNLVLLIVAAILVYMVGFKPAEQTATARLFATAPYQAKDIYIQRSDKPDIHIRRDKEGWYLTQPGIAPLNREKIKQLLTILQEPVIASYDVAEKDLSRFGLAPGKIKLTINAEEATFGATNPVTLNRYILKNNKIYTIREIVYGTLGSSIATLLTHKLLPDDYKVVDVAAPALFKHTPVQSWTRIQASDLADMTGEETIIGKIQLTVQQKPKSGKESSNTGKPVAGEKRTIELDILATTPSLILGRPDLQVKYTFKPEQMKALSLVLH